MNANTTVCFRNVEKTDDVLQLIESKSRKLARRHPRVAHCQVVVERPHAKHQSGNDLCALVRAVAPGAEVVGRARAAKGGDEDAAAAIADAFRAVERQLGSRSTRSSSGLRRPARQELGDAA